MSSNQKQKIDKVEVYKKWKSLVNMTKGELEKFYNSEEGKEAGLSSSKAKSLGIHSGRESARWIMKMKDTPHDKWTPTMWDWANRQISFISRMSGNKGGLYDENGNKTRKLTSLLIWGHNPEKHKAGGSLSKTPAPKSDKVYGSEKNAKGSSKDLASSKKINFDAATLSSIKSKVQEHNKKYPSKKVTIEAAKAVVRRGMGAYSVTHRPTIKGGKPNSRVAWALARLNAFLYKAVNGNSKSGKYSQDNDLMDELHIPHKKYAGGGEILLAPNGKQSNLTPKQYKLVRTPAFKAWFGDWENDPQNASKVVDENGEPMVVYHGSREDFNIFKFRDKYGWENTNKGFYFTSNPNVAEIYTDSSNRTAHVKSFFLNIRNYYTHKNNIVGFVSEQKNGYDGERGDGFYNSKPFLEIVAYYPNQIKLADGRNTTFDMNNPDVRYAEGGIVNLHGNDYKTEYSYSEFKNPYEKSGKPLSIKLYSKINVDGQDIVVGYLWTYLQDVDLHTNIKEKRKEYILRDKEKKDVLKHILTKGYNQYLEISDINVNYNVQRQGIYHNLLEKLSNIKKLPIISFEWGRNKMSELFWEGNKNGNISNVNSNYIYYPNKNYKEGGLIAPNGKESNLTPEQYKLVRTPAFKKWFGDWENYPENSSKVVDSNGEPLPVFHGTTHEFYEFTKTRGNLDNHFGLGYYFTDSKIDVEENYLKEGADITNRVELVKERIQQKLEDEYSEYNDLIEDAENVSETYSVSVEEIEALDDFSELAEIISNKRLIGGKEIIITAFLTFFNPMDLTSRYSVYDALEHINEDGENEENADSLPMKLFDAMNSVAYNFNEIDVQKIWNDISEGINYDWDGVSFYQVDELMRNSEGLIYVTDENGESASNEFIRSVYEEMGYDGIIMDADLQFGNRRKFGVKMKMDRGTKHYIAFEPTQIKLSDGTNTTFDKNNPDIRYEKGGKVEEGEKFTEKGGNKIVDEKGKPLTLYHSTFSDFREFNEGINYFAENKKYSEDIAKITNRNGKSSDYVEERPIRTIPVNIAAARVYELPKGEEMNSNKIKSLINNDTEFTKKYDAVKGIDLYSKNEIVYAVFDKSNIKIIEHPKEFSAESDKYFEYVPLNEIEPYKEQDREIIRKYDKSYLDEVTEDIKTNGIKRPINLEVYSGKGLVTEGNHRIAAAKRLGLKYIPVRVIDRYKDFGSINKHLAVKLPDSIPHWRYQREHPEISPLDWNNSAAAYGFTKINPNKFEKGGVAKKDFQCANCDETFKISSNDNYICPNCDYDNETEYIMSVLKPTKTLEELSSIHNVPLEQLQLQFQKGIATEMEHTTDKRIAQVIALHHIEEMPDYYDKLSLIEEKQYKNGGVADCGCGINMKYDEGGVLIVESNGNCLAEKFLIKNTGQVIELEGGEGIMCPNSMQSDRNFTFEGNRMTGRQVASHLNNKYGGIEFAHGGEVGHVLGCSKFNEGGELPTYTLDELKGGEGVVCVRAMDSNDKYSFNGSFYTPKQILSQINLANGGKKFEEGGVIDLKKYKLQMSNKLAKMVYFAEKLLHLV